METGTFDGRTTLNFSFELNEFKRRLLIDRIAEAFY
jgi:hypothetical protein